VELARMFKKNYFKDHPYIHDRLGTSESVSSFTRDDVLAFYRRMVNPGSSVLAIYGDVDVAGLQEKLNNKLSSWKGSAVALPALPLETRRVEADRTVEKTNEKTSAALFIGTDGLTIGDAERPVMDVLDAVLSGISYPSGRLEEALRGGNNDLVYVVHAFPFYGIEAGYFGVMTQTTMGNLDKVQTVISQNLRRLANEPVPAAELEIGKNIVITMHHLALESLDAQAQSAAVNEVLGLGWDYSRRYPEMVRAVRVEDIQKLAKELFTHTLTVRTLPEKPVEILAPRAEVGHVRPQ
jgi:zinc protease